MKLRELFDLELNICLQLLREHGVKSLRVGDVSLTLADLPHQVKSEVESNFPDELDKQKCGHYAYEANELGECLHGCLPTEDNE